MKRPVGIIVSILVALSTPPGAFAQSAPKALDQAFAAAADGLGRQIIGCIARQPSTRTEVLVLAVPRFTLHLDDTARAIVNGSAARAIDALQNFYANPIEQIGILPSILRGAGSSAALAATIEQRYDADVVFSIDTARPDPDTLVLRLDLLGRDQDGNYGCTATDTLILDVNTLLPATLATSRDDYVLLTGALADALRGMTVPIEPEHTVSVRVRPALPGRCELQDDLAGRVLSTIFALRDGGLPVLSRSPAIRESPADDGASDPEDFFLDVSARRTPRSDRAVVLTVALRRGEEVKAYGRYDAIVPAAALEGCVEPPAPSPASASEPARLEEPSPGPEVPPVLERADFLFYPDRAGYRVGDRIMLTLVPPEDCRLTLINVDGDGDSCVLLPHPAVKDLLLRAGEPFLFPPRGVMRAEEAGEETFIALCNATAAAKAEARALTEPVACSGGEAERAYEVRALETVVVDYGADPDADDPPGEIVRRTLRINVEH